MTPLRTAGLAASAVAALFALTTAATAKPAPAPVSGDERAVAYDGNVDINHRDACTVGGLSGTPIAPGQFTFTGGANQQDVDITAVPAGTTITGVVVKGGDAYNVYLAPKLASLPWNDLRAPQNNGGQVPAISHWYACGTTTQQSSSSSSTTTTTTTTTTTSSSGTTTTTTSPVTTTTTSSSGAVTSAPAVTTTNAAVVPVNEDDDLASTGFGSAWLIGLGAALLAAGAAVLFVLRRRRA
ncbi:LPXTG cell wall anchor domain-containing protein [Lentzea sp. NPDC042327]|uniref:LPXTG cell wall anchor domain-containing protein n=1 Tax=Lentzea sp. NPDC042327 TaxID=3154801 RepID=UPI0033DF9B6F